MKGKVWNCRERKICSERAHSSWKPGHKHDKKAHLLTWGVFRTVSWGSPALRHWVSQGCGKRPGENGHWANTTERPHRKRLHNGSILPWGPGRLRATPSLHCNCSQVLFISRLHSVPEPLPLPPPRVRPRWPPTWRAANSLPIAIDSGTCLQSAHLLPAQSRNAFKQALSTWERVTHPPHLHPYIASNRPQNGAPGQVSCSVPGPPPASAAPQLCADAPV